MTSGAMGVALFQFAVGVVAGAERVVGAQGGPLERHGQQFIDVALHQHCDRRGLPLWPAAGTSGVGAWPQLKHRAEFCVSSSAI